MRTMTRENIVKKLAVVLAVSLVVAGSVGALSIASSNETGADFQDGTVTGEAEIVGDTVTVDAPSSSSVTASNLTNQVTVGDRSGVSITPNQNVEGLKVSVSPAVTPNADGYVEVYLLDPSGTLIGFYSAQPGGAAVPFDESLSSGETYKLLIDGDGGFYEWAKGDSLPKSSSLFDVSQGHLPDGSTTSEMVNFDGITAYTDNGKGEYVSDTHTVTDARELNTNFSQVDGVAEIQWERYENGSWSLINSEFVSDPGDYTTAVSDSGSHTYRVTVTFDRSTTGGQIVYQSDSVTFNSTTPNLNDASPTGETTVSQSPVGLEIGVSDADFATSQGDSVTVDFYDGDGTKLGSDTLSQNGTATANYSDPAGGANQWYAVATDSYGNTVTSQNFTFNAPAEIEIRSEQSGELLTGVDVTLEFYEQSATNEIYTPPVTNGTADMTGLPADENFIAVAEADGYANRRIFIDSLIETQTVYLLNNSADAVAVEFELDDFSGRFQQDTSVLVVEREINGSYTPIQGDFFGAAGTFEATLVRDVRHRLRIRNLETGREAVIGTFTPQSSGPQTLTIEPDGDIQLTQQSERVSAQPALGVIGATDDAAFTVDIDEGDTTIQNYSVVVEHRPGNGSTETLATRSGSGAASEDFALNLTDKDGIIAAEVTTTTSSGTTTTLITREIRESYPGANGLVGGLNDVGIGLNAGDGASGASSMTAFLVSVLVTAGVGSQSGSVEVSGLAALGSLSGFAILGWLSMQVLFASAVAFGAMVLLRRGI